MKDPATAPLGLAGVQARCEVKLSLVKIWWREAAASLYISLQQNDEVHCISRLNSTQIQQLQCVSRIKQRRRCFPLIAPINIHIIVNDTSIPEPESIQPQHVDRCNSSIRGRQTRRLPIHGRSSAGWHREFCHATNHDACEGS